MDSAHSRNSRGTTTAPNEYSITALTDALGSIVERYAHDAYGGLSVFDGSGTTRTSSTEANRYTYTGREWDEDLDLYHFRARMYDSVSGRFVSRDPIGYEGSKWNLQEYINGSPMDALDPSGKSGFGHFGHHVTKCALKGGGKFAWGGPVAWGVGIGVSIRPYTAPYTDPCYVRLFYKLCPSGSPPLPAPPDGPKAPPRKRDDECNCCKYAMEEDGHQYPEVSDCKPRSKVECESDWERSCMPPDVKDGDRDVPKKGPDGEDWPYNPDHPILG